VSPGFIDTHVHLTMDAANLALQTLQSSAAKALAGLRLAREYMSYGFTTLRDLGSVDPEFPTIDLRNALNSGLVEGPRLFVAAHIISASAGHGDLRGFYASRWALPVSAIADDHGSIRALVRREHTFGSDWIKTANTGGYFSHPKTGQALQTGPSIPPDDPVRLSSAPRRIGEPDFQRTRLGPELAFRNIPTFQHSEQPRNEEHVAQAGLNRARSGEEAVRN